MDSSRDSEDDESSYTQSDSGIVEIKKETKSTITLDRRTYEKIASQINKNILVFQKLNTEQRKELKSQSAQTDNKEEINKYEMKIKDLTDKNSTLTIENEVLQSKVNSLIYDNSKLKNDYEQMKNKYKERNEKLLKEKNELIKQLKEMNNIKEDLTKKISHMKDRSPSEDIINNEKCLNAILSFLPFDYHINFLSLNHQIHSLYFYKKKNEILQKRVSSLEKIISSLSSDDVSIKYNLHEEVIQKLLDKYTNDHIIPGTQLRYRIIHSLLFIENIVRKPLRDVYAVHKKEEDFSSKTMNILSNIISVIKDEDEVTELNNQIDDKSGFGVIKMPKGKTINFSEEDKRTLHMINDNENINVKFEFTSPNQIKTLLNYFIDSNLKKENYATFFQCLFEEYSELLYECYSSIKEIKELEIVNTSINCRYKRFKYLCQDMQSEILDLRRFVSTSKEIKDMLIKQKNQIEFKYNDALLEISRLKKEKESYMKNIDDIDKERINAEKEFFEFKNKILSEFKLVETKLTFANKEKDIYKQTLLDFKAYFMKHVSEEGEIINK